MTNVKKIQIPNQPSHHLWPSSAIKLKGHAQKKHVSGIHIPTHFFQDA